jgi:hypothetical protein
MKTFVFQKISYTKKPTQISGSERRKQVQRNDSTTESARQLGWVYH